jgi:hypothetical protein
VPGPTLALSFVKQSGRGQGLERQERWTDDSRPSGLSRAGTTASRSNHSRTSRGAVVWFIFRPAGQDVASRSAVVIDSGAEELSLMLSPCARRFGSRTDNNAVFGYSEVESNR